MGGASIDKRRTTRPCQNRRTNSDRKLAFDFQNAISDAESKLLEMGNVKACLLLSKLSLVQMIELGMTDSNDPKSARMLKKVPATRTQDFAPVLGKLIAEVRSGNSG